MIGISIDHYHILEEIGRGGMGVVYKAQDTKLDRVVALKFLPSDIPIDGGDHSRFLQEAKAAATLNHPNVCTIHAIGSHDGQSFIDMEFVGGGTLRQKLARGPLGVSEAVSCVTQICEALQEAHSKGIVHRDVKPENIMITPAGRVKIMDFGLARLKGAALTTLTRSTAGTTAYMSPEQIQGSPSDHRSDIWAVGVIMYEIVAGKRPFEGEHEAAVIYSILNSDPQALHAVRPEVPAEYGALVSQLLQKDPSKRIGSISEVLEKLQRAPVSVSQPQSEKSIAVLYFENISPDKESDYFCAGITEDIITDLSRIRGLKVISRTDVQAFRGKEVNTRLVGEALHVNHILEGSVRKAGNRIRISAQLIDATTGYHVWAERFDRNVDDIFELQDEVSRKIAEALKVSLTDTERELLASKPTDDLRAYDFYLRAREFLSRRGRKNNLLAIQMLQNALALDPDFSAAYAVLAEAYVYMYGWYDGTAEWIEKAVEASKRAAGPGPASVEAAFGRGMVLFHQKRYAEAKSAFEESVRQKTDFYDAYRWLGHIADIEGSHLQAIRFYEICSRIKPFSEEPWVFIYMGYLRMGETAKAEEAKRKVIDVAEKIIELNPDNTVTLSRMAAPLFEFGQKERALEILRRIMEMDPADGLVLYNCGCAYATIGKKQEALAAIQRAVEKGYKNTLAWMKIDPDLSSIADEPEFKALLVKYG